MKARFVLATSLLLAIISLLASATDAASSKGPPALPQSAQSRISEVLGSDIPAYQITSTGRDLRAQNLVQGFSARFNTQGVEFVNGDVHWRMAVRAYGLGHTLTSLGLVAPEAHANRVEYRRGNLIEWYANGPGGVEQGFSIRERPGRTKGQPLTIALSLSGDGVAAEAEGGKELVPAKHAPTNLRYAGLTAYDADGKEMRAWLELQGTDLLLHADDSGARYPVVVDPVVRLAKLTTSYSGDHIFGSAIAIDGDTVVIGDEIASVGKGHQQGAAYVFVKPANGWHNMVQTARLTASDGKDTENFGSSVAIRGKTIAIGSYCHSQGQHVCQGALYVFQQPANGWEDMTETAELTASDDHSRTGFLLGWSVGLSGDGNTVFGGAPAAAEEAGAVYVFAKPTGGWRNMTQSAELTASDARPHNILGITLASSGDEVAAGSPGWPDGGGDPCCQGAAYVFVAPKHGWTNMTETARLTASDGVPFDGLGYVALQGGTLLAGAPGENNQQGAAYVFLQPRRGWKTTSRFAAKLTAFDGQSRDGFGGTTDINGNSIAVGAIGYHGFKGAAFFYLKPLSGWRTTSKYNFKRMDPANQSAFFGAGIAQQGNISIVGAYGEKPAGAAYVYRRTANGLEPQ